MKLNRRFVTAFVLSALLLPGLSFSSFGASSTLTPDAKAAADQGALSLTLYLTDALHLSQGQALKVRECTRHELQLLAATPEAGSAPDATLLVQQEYDEAMARILTPEQYQAFRALERGPIVSSTLSRVLAAR